MSREEDFLKGRWLSDHLLFLHHCLIEALLITNDPLDSRDCYPCCFQNENHVNHHLLHQLWKKEMPLHFWKKKCKGISFFLFGSHSALPFFSPESFSDWLFWLKTRKDTLREDLSPTSSITMMITSFTWKCSFMPCFSFSVWSLMIIGEERRAIMFPWIFLSLNVFLNASSLCTDV